MPCPILLYKLARPVQSEAGDLSSVPNCSNLEHWRCAIACTLPQSTPSPHRLSNQPTMKNDGSLMAGVFILIADMFEMAWPFALKWSVKLGIREQRNIILSSA